jgi:hypothetical protein
VYFDVADTVVMISQCIDVTTRAMDIVASHSESKQSVPTPRNATPTPFGNVAKRCTST